MKNDKKISTPGLRGRAEELLKTKKSAGYSSLSSSTTLKLLNELQVHQIELEMQNGALLQARYELETLLEKYTDLYDFAPVGHLTLDCNGNIIAVNLVGAGLLGGARSFLIGRRFGQFVAVADRPAFTDFLATVLTCKIKESCEIALLDKGNRAVFVQIEAMATASGQEFRLALIDISGRRHAEDALMLNRLELEELNHSLEARIARSLDDQRRNDQVMILQDRRAVMGDMVNNIAHQWRQPLNVLGLYLQDLSVVYGSAEFNREYLAANVDKSMQLIRHMSQTVNDFMTFFRSDKELVTFSVTQVIEQTVFLIAKNFEAQQIHIDFQIDDNPLITGYPNEYSQVLMNILMNARDALIGNHTVTAKISIHAFTEERTTIVTITDNGGGIAETIIDRIFDPYFTTKGPDKGTGIGLFMSKTIIEKNMNGYLTVSNSKDGAEFRISIRYAGTP